MNVLHPIFAGDPLFSNGIDTEVVIIVIVKTILVFAILLVGVMFLGVGLHAYSAAVFMPRNLERGTGVASAS